MADINQFMNTPPTDEEVRTAFKRIEDHKRKLADPADTTEIDKAEQEARRLYEEKANRAEWVGVAERLGNALVRLGAAERGRNEGVDLSGINLGKPLDQESKIDRYGREYTTELERLGRKRKGAEEAQAAAQKTLDREYEDTLAGLKGNLDLARYKYGQNLDTFQAGQRDRELVARQEAAASRRRKEELEDQDRREATRLKNANLADLSREEKNLVAQNQAMETLSNQMQQEGDLSGKSVAKLQEKYGALAARAGVDLVSLQRKLEDQEGFFKSGKDEEKDKKAILTQELNKTKNLLDAIRQRKQELLAGVSSQQPTKQVSDDKVQVKNPQGKIGLIPRSQLQQALSQGYTLVNQMAGESK